MIRGLGLLMLLAGLPVVGWAASAGGTGGNIRIQSLAWDEEATHQLGARGREALGIEEIAWQHAESEHFVFHFVHSWMAERAAAEAETFYAATKKDLKVEDDRWERKGQIFLFETEDSWKRFVEKSGVDRWSGGVCAGNEIFALAPPRAQPFTGLVLPHELAHMVVNRFVRGQVPIWLNEGFAEQQSRKHFAVHTRPRGYHFALRLDAIPEGSYIPLAELTGAGSYPDDPARVMIFYAESARLVQFLIEDHPDEDFREFLQIMADGAHFESALEQVYGHQYRNVEAFEEKFREVILVKAKTEVK